MPCRVTLHTKKGEVWVKEMSDYPGFVTRPMSWDVAREKFEYLTAPYCTHVERDTIAEAVESLETIAVSALMELLKQVRPGGGIRG